MANHPSALKRARQSEKRRLRNKSIKTRVKNVTKDVEQAIKEKDFQKISVAVSEAVSVIQKAAQKGVIHKNKASRKVSNLMRKAQALAKAQG